MVQNPAEIGIPHHFESQFGGLVGGSQLLSIRAASPDDVPLGFLEIDRTVAGRCCGGIRASSTVSPAELRRLARVMTLKCGYLGLAAGGAKAGVLVPEAASSNERLAILRAFGVSFGPVLRSGVYSFGSDLGTTDADIHEIRRAAGLRGGTATPSSTGAYAGLTVALATVAALRARGHDPRGARIAVQGFGSVGRAVVAALDREGARIVAVATVHGTLHREAGIAVEDLLRRWASEGDAVVTGDETRPPHAALEVHCDALIPCATTGAVDLEAARRVAAPVVVCGANDPFRDGAEAVLTDRNVLIVPDFVANGGGVLGSTLAAAGAAIEEVESLFRRRFARRVASTIDEALARGETVTSLAERKALRFLDACEWAHASSQPPGLLPEALAPRPTPATRLLLSLEERVRPFGKLKFLGRRLRPFAARQVEEILTCGWAAGEGVEPPAPKRAGATGGS